MLKTPGKMHMYDMVKIDKIVFEIVGVGGFKMLYFKWEVENNNLASSLFTWYIYNRHTTYMENTHTKNYYLD